VLKLLAEIPSLSLTSQEGEYMKSTHSYISWRMDMDYWKSLNPEERAWLRQFSDEYYMAKFPKEMPALHPDNTEVEIIQYNQVSMGTYRQERYSAYSAAQRDLYTKGWADVAATQVPGRSKVAYSAQDYNTAGIYENISITVTQKD
jgi:hypothetical protein